MTIQGLAHISGITGVLTWAAQGTNSVATSTSTERSHKWDTLSTINNPATGEVVGLTVARESFEATIEFVATSDGGGGTNTKAKALGALKTPPIMAVCTLTDATNRDPDLATSTGLKWNYIGGWSVSQTVDGATKVKCSLRRYTASGSDPDTLAAAAS